MKTVTPAFRRFYGAIGINLKYGITSKMKRNKENKNNKRRSFRLKTAVSL